jgi:hypothetical protein
MLSISLRNNHNSGALYVTGAHGRFPQVLSGTSISRHRHDVTSRAIPEAVPSFGGPSKDQELEFFVFLPFLPKPAKKNKKINHPGCF